MAFATVCVSMTFMMAGLVSPSRDEPQLPVETLADIVISVQQYVRSGCVFFLCPATSGKFPTFFLLIETLISYIF